jgi:hypothetical protein
MIKIARLLTPPKQVTSEGSNHPYNQLLEERDTTPTYGSGVASTRMQKCVSPVLEVVWQYKKYIANMAI